MWSDSGLIVEYFVFVLILFNFFFYDLAFVGLQKLLPILEFGFVFRLFHGFFEGIEFIEHAFCYCFGQVVELGGSGYFYKFEDSM